MAIEVYTQVSQIREEEQAVIQEEAQKLALRLKEAPRRRQKRLWSAWPVSGR